MPSYGIVSEHLNCYPIQKINRFNIKGTVYNLFGFLLAKIKYP